MLQVQMLYSLQESFLSGINLGTLGTQRFKTSQVTGLMCKIHTPLIDEILKLFQLSFNYFKTLIYRLISFRCVLQIVFLMFVEAKPDHDV